MAKTIASLQAFPSSLLPRAWSRAPIPFPFPFERLPRRLTGTQNVLTVRPSSHWQKNSFPLKGHEVTGKRSMKPLASIVFNNLKLSSKHLDILITIIFFIKTFQKKEKLKFVQDSLKHYVSILGKRCVQLNEKKKSSKDCPYSSKYQSTSRRTTDQWLKLTTPENTITYHSTLV